MIVKTALETREPSPVGRFDHATTRTTGPSRRGGGRFAPVRAGDRAADGSVFSGRLSTGHGRVLPAVKLQSDLPHEGDAGLVWTSPYHFGINLGPVVLMCENYRSGLLWRLMRACPYVVTGLRRAGFTNGWL